MLGDYAATGNWLYGKKSGSGLYLEELRAGKQIFLAAKSFLLTTNLGDSGIFIYRSSCCMVYGSNTREKIHISTSISGIQIGPS